MKIGLKKVIEVVIVYNSIGGVTFFIYYYLSKRWSSIFGQANQNHLTGEFIASCFLWPIIGLMLFVDVIKHLNNKHEYNPIKFLCKKIDKLVDKQQGKLNKDIVFNFKIK